MQITSCLDQCLVAIGFPLQMTFQCEPNHHQNLFVSIVGVAAELLADARALSLANSYHFELNLSGLLDKATRCKRNWLLNVLAATQRFVREQTNFEGIQTFSATNSKKWMTAGRASQWTSSTLCLPTPHPLGMS